MYSGFVTTLLGEETDPRMSLLKETCPGVELLVTAAADV